MQSLKSFLNFPQKRSSHGRHVIGNHGDAVEVFVCGSCVAGHAVLFSVRGHSPSGSEHLETRANVFDKRSRVPGTCTCVCFVFIDLMYPRPCARSLDK